MIMGRTTKVMELGFLHWKAARAVKLEKAQLLAFKLLITIFSKYIMTIILQISKSVNLDTSILELHPMRYHLFTIPNSITKASILMTMTSIKVEGYLTLLILVHI